LGLFYFKVYGNLKTVRIMSNIKLRFCESIEQTSDPHELEVFANGDNGITFFTYSNNVLINVVSFDKQTAIKFSKELRKQINILNYGK